MVAADPARNIPGEFAIDALLFSTFFGGNGAEWAPDTEQSAQFDDFIVWTEQPVSASP